MKKTDGEEWMVEQERLYSIGEVSKICDVSKRMLRYYEEIGLILPDYTAESSRFRYYTVQTMQQVQNIRYLIDQGFNLEEIKIVLSENDVKGLQGMFLQKIRKAHDDVEYYRQRWACLRAWYALLVEGEEVFSHGNQAISARYITKARFFCYKRRRKEGELDPVAHLETEGFTLTKHNGHSMVDMGGAFHVLYNSYQERVDDTYCDMTLLQATFPNGKSSDHTMDFGGFMAVSGYHIGPLEGVAATYERMLQWARAHRFRLRGDCFERHVLDIYSVADSRNFVTEILLPVLEDTEGYDFLSGGETL